MNININCQNIYETLNNNLGEKKDGVEGILKTACKEDSNNLSGICDIIPLFISSEPYIDIIKEQCPSIINQCTPTLCDSKKESTLVISCDNLKKIMNIVLKNDTSPPKSQNELCELVETIGGKDNIMKLLSNNQTIKNKLQPLLPEIKKNLPIMLECICPKSEKETITENVYNTGIIGLLGGVIVFVGIIITIVFLHKRPIYIVIIWVVLLLVYLCLVIINPKCIFKTCLKGGEDWKPIEGYFKGTKTLFGLTIKLEINIKKDNTATLNVLTCDGKGCPPSKNMIDKCSNKNVNISKIKTPMGYSLFGPCIDKIKSITTSDGSTVVRGLSVIRQKGDIKVQLSLHFVYDGIKFNKSLLVNLQKYIPTT